jgi:hypothetical protein
MKTKLVIILLLIGANTYIQAQDAGTKPIFVSLNQITKDYSDNEITAEKKWLGKNVVIEGVIQDVYRDTFGRPTITMYGNDELVYFVFPDDYSLNKCKSGQRIKIKGRVGAVVFIALSIIDCSIYNE